MAKKCKVKLRTVAERHAARWRSDKFKELKGQKPKNFDCKQCGRCCLIYGGLLQASSADIKLWEKEGRDDILKWECWGELWINRDTNTEAFRCPFLRKLPNKDKYICRIYDFRPEVCRGYPVDLCQAKTDRCRGIGCG